MEKGKARRSNLLFFFLFLLLLLLLPYLDEEKYLEPRNVSSLSDILLAPLPSRMELFLLFIVVVEERDLARKLKNIWLAVVITPDVARSGGDGNDNGNGDRTDDHIALLWTMSLKTRTVVVAVFDIAALIRHQISVHYVRF